MQKCSVHTSTQAESRVENRCSANTCRRRNGEAVHRAVNFGDLIKADHKVLSDNCESRNNHRYAVVVQDLATQWIQAYPCKNKTSQETHRSLQKFLEPRGNQKSFTLTIPWNSAKLVKIFPGIIARGQRDGVPKAGLQQAAADSRGSRTCVECYHPCYRGGSAGEEG